jgi:hypothetical protein
MKFLVDIPRHSHAIIDIYPKFGVICVGLDVVRGQSNSSSTRHLTRVIVALVNGTPPCVVLREVTAPLSFLRSHAMVPVVMPFSSRKGRHAPISQLSDLVRVVLTVPTNSDAHSLAVRWVAEVASAPLSDFGTFVISVRPSPLLCYERLLAFFRF